MSSALANSTSLAQPAHDTPSPSSPIVNISRQSSSRSLSLSSSSRTNITEKASCSSSSASNSDSDSDSADDEGIFFGTPDAREAKHIAKLSAIATPSRPLVRKRDSREFLRRKTLLLSAKANASPLMPKKESAEKEWSGGFYVRGAKPRERDPESEDERGTPRSVLREIDSPTIRRQPLGEEDEDEGEEEAEHCDLTFDFGNFRLSDVSPAVQRAQSSNTSQRRTTLDHAAGGAVSEDDDDAEDDDDEDYGDSDKENNEALVSPASVKSEHLSLEERPEFLLALGRNVEAYEEDDDDSLQVLNMGGLRLTDFSDPDSADGNEEDVQQDEEYGDLGSSSESGNESDLEMPAEEIHEELELEDDLVERPEEVGMILQVDEQDQEGEENEMEVGDEAEGMAVHAMDMEVLAMDDEKSEEPIEVQREDELGTAMLHQQEEELGPSTKAVEVVDVVEDGHLETFDEAEREDESESLDQGDLSVEEVEQGDEEDALDEVVNLASEPEEEQVEPAMDTEADVELFDEAETVQRIDFESDTPVSAENLSIDSTSSPAPDALMSPTPSSKTVRESLPSPEESLVMESPEAADDALEAASSSILDESGSPSAVVFGEDPEISLVTAFLPSEDLSESPQNGTSPFAGHSVGSPSTPLPARGDNLAQAPLSKSIGSALEASTPATLAPEAFTNVAATPRASTPASPAAVTTPEALASAVTDDRMTPLEISTPQSASSTSITSADDLENGSPLPTHRAPAVIPLLPPHLSRNIRAESGSPYRALPPSINHDIALTAQDDTRISLPPLNGSPVISAPTPSHLGLGLPSQAVPYATPARTGSSTLHPHSINGKPRTLMPASVDQAKALARSAAKEKKVAARVGKIKSQLDTVFVSRLGPPQRSASGSSANSSSSSASTSRPLGASTSVSAPSRMSRAAMPKVEEQAKAVRVSKPVQAATTTMTASSSARVIKPSAPKAVPAPRLQASTISKPSVKAAAIAPAPPRQPLVPRAAPPPAATVRQPKGLGRPTLVRPGMPAARPLAASVSVPAGQTSPSKKVNPLKRPLSATQPTLGRSLVSTALTHPASRPALGLPSRGGRDTPPFGSTLHAPPVSIGAHAESAGMTFGGVRSPQKLGCSKMAETPRKLGTPSRVTTPKARLGVPLGQSKLGGASPARPPSALLLGTPGRPTRLGKAGEVIHPAPVAAPINVMSIGQDIKANPRELPTADQRDDSPAIRGSSEDNADVSYMLAPKSSSPPAESTALGESTESTTPQGSPMTRSSAKGGSPKKASPKKASPETESKTTVEVLAPEPRRAKRSIRPPTALLKTVSKPASAPPPSNVPGISDKELRAATQRNTDRNTVYMYCTIDRRIVRQNCPRPPSPTSKIRTTADRDEEEKKAGRGERAKRRSAKDSNETDGDVTFDLPVIERVERARGPGDDDDYETPARPSKKVKTRHERRVMWDRELVIIRDDGRPQVDRAGSGQAAKSALRADGQIELDRFGNAVDTARPKEAIKKQKIAVTAVFYEGEEPMSYEPAYITSNLEKEKVKPVSKARKK